MVEDLDMIESPEGMLLRAVTGEDTQDRTDRLLLTPWVKYLWESYRQCLDLLRNNCRVERLYHTIAQQAFKFCLNYDRRTEFRKLCDNLRNHVKLSEQRHGAQFSVNLSNPETQALHLETRIAQLDAAIQIELWQEAFKAVEDIHYLMSLSKRPPKPQMLANFHNKLCLVFWKAGNMLFHACSRHRLFHLTRDMKKNATPDDLARMASLMLVATLAIPITEQKHGVGKILDMENALIDKHLNLSKLLGLDRPQTRDLLIKDFLKYNLLQYCPQQLRDLYQWLEKDFHPLRLTGRVSGVLHWIKEQTREPELVQYIPYLENIVISRVLQQVSQVYQTIEINRLLELLPFCSRLQLERTIVDAARNGQLQIRIDHNLGSLSFGTDLNASPLYVEDEFFETYRLQKLPSERVSERFNVMAKALLVANQMLNSRNIENDVVRQQQAVYSYYQKTRQKDHEAILERKFIIEQRKERLEHITLEKERKEQRAMLEQEEAVKVAEQQRLNKEQKEREAQRRKELEEEEKRRTATDRIEMIRKSEIGQKMLKDIDLNNLDEINPDELMKRQMETMEREKKELQDRLKAQEKKVDFFERAKRREEIPFLKAKYEQKRLDDMKMWDKLEDEKIEQMKVDQKFAMSNKLRMDRMRSDREVFLDHLCQTRRAVYEDKMSAYNELLAKERAIRLARRREARKEERRQKWHKDKEEAEQRKKDEELKRKREEEEREKQEREEEETRAYEEKMRILKEQQERQKAREREIEEKLERDKKSFGAEAGAGRPERDSARPWGAPRGGDKERDMGAWRRGGGREVDEGRGDSRPGGDVWKRGARDRDVPHRDPSPPSRSWRRRSPPRDQPPQRDLERPSPRGGQPRDDGGSWRRPASPRRTSPPGRRRSPPGRRTSPAGRGDSPPRRSSPPGRRRSPAGRRSPPPPARSAWRKDAPSDSSSSWRGGGGRDRGSDGRDRGQEAPSSNQPWRPRFRQGQQKSDAPPSDGPRRKPPSDDDWTTVRR
uniref:Eukaryotic translation initiation factor 3 subunit A n=1 Tax=Phallusia mammillata TaxID=59560 RepID=A0A6F9DB60_9ASCI|nr:eukaryotic translation initiation factor 3 subunit A [Phallusia mammillata]